MFRLYIQCEWNIVILVYSLFLSFFGGGGGIVPFEDFSLIWRRYYYRWKATNFDLCSALMVIEQWEFYSSLVLSPRTGNTHTYCRAFSCGAVIIWFYDLGLSRQRFEHPTIRLRGQSSIPLCERHGQSPIEIKDLLSCYVNYLSIE